MKKQSFWSKVGAFLAGRGFYMVLVLCLAAIGGSGWFLWKEYQAAAAEASAAAKVTVTEPADTSEEKDAAKPSQDTSKGSDAANKEPAKESAATEQADEAAAPEETETAETAATQSDQKKTEQATDSEKASEQPTSDAKDDKETAKTDASQPTAAQAEVTETAAADGWLWPLEGEVVAAFSNDTLTYNEALKDWRTHNGVDLSAGLGDEVLSACNGTVLEVSDDLLLGRMVTVDCGDGVTAHYGNLAEECEVTAGDKVAAGDVLGVVGTTAVGENSGAAWLHFAVEEDGVAVDPMDYLN